MNEMSPEEAEDMGWNDRFDMEDEDRVEGAAREMLEVIKETRKIVSDGAMTGFRWNKGDWAYRLYANQTKLSAAIRRAEGK